MRRLMTFIANTVDFSLDIWWPTDGTNTVSYWSDSNHNTGKHKFDTRSQTGIMVLLNNVPVHWRSRKQPMTSISTASAEVYALSECVKEARLFQWRLEEMGATLPYPMPVCVDASCAKSFQERTCTNTQLKGTFDLRDSWVRELQDMNLVKIIKVSSQENHADLLTKSFQAPEFTRLVNGIRNAK